jgi:hypothetical protein
MSNAITVLALALAADNPALGEESGPGQPPRVELEANATTILQRDPLFLMSLVQNRETADIRLFNERHETGAYAILYLRYSGEWRRIPTMEEIRARRLELEGEQKGRAVLSGSSFAEYHAIHREGREKSAFLFEEPGTYEVQAVVKTADRQLTSKPLIITVEARPTKDLERIAAASKQLRYLEFFRLQQWTPPDEVKALEDVGGNIGMAIRNALLLQEYARSGKIEGKEIPKDQISDFLKQRFDSISWTIALERLANQYWRWSDKEGMRCFARVMPHDSLERRELLRHMRLLAHPDDARYWIRQDFGRDGQELVESD